MHRLNCKVYLYLFVQGDRGTQGRPGPPGPMGSGDPGDLVSYQVYETETVLFM